MPNSGPDNAAPVASPEIDRGDMAGSSFFDEYREQSQVKTAIVSKYFAAWCKVIVPWAKTRSNRIAYMDLFAGPGRYKDGSASTPLKVIELAISDPDLRNMLVAHFNDGNADHSGILQSEIAKLSGVNTLKYQPVVHNQEVGEEIVKAFEQMNLVPTFFFVDPWGYKGLSLRLVNSVLKDWGCDCVFFFNYNRISMGLANDLVRAHMDALFGEQRGARVRERIEGAAPKDREFIIVEELAEALRALGGKFVLPFRFKDERGTRTSHHLIFVSKNVRGYTIMKGIMANESSRRDQGVPSFEYNPADERFPLLFELTRPLNQLEDMLLVHFAGRTMTMLDVFDQHHVDKPFIQANYKDALRNLEARGQIQTNPPAASRRKNKGVVTFADSVSVTFPRRT